jgi:hypothetical protein
LSRTDVGADGEPRVDPLLGSDPIALLIYDGAGRFSAQFMKRDRSQIVEGPARAGPNNTGAVGGYDAYFGTYSIDDATGEVTQTLTGALSPGNVGMTLTRAMTVEGDRLLIQLRTTSVAGEPVTRTLVWRRVG